MDVLGMNVLPILLLFIDLVIALKTDHNDIGHGHSKNTTTPEIVPCLCGVFMSGQFKRGSLPQTPPVFLHEYDNNMACSSIGNKQCTNKCLEVLVRHLSNSQSVICGLIDRDCYRERAYLFIKNCNDNWVNSNLSAGREYCCKDGVPYKCR